MADQAEPSNNAHEFAQAMAAAGVPNPDEQAAFMDLMLKVRTMQQVVESCRWFWENDLESGVEALTETTRPKVEALVRMIRRLQSFHVDAPVPNVVFRAVVDADAALREFTLACMPVRVLH